MDLIKDQVDNPYLKIQQSNMQQLGRWKHGHYTMFTVHLSFYFWQKKDELGRTEWSPQYNCTLDIMPTKTKSKQIIETYLPKSAIRAIQPNRWFSLDSGKSAVSLRNCTLVTFHLAIAVCHRCSHATFVLLVVPETVAFLHGSERCWPTVTVFAQQITSA